MSAKSNDFQKYDIYAEYYKIIGMWWAKGCDMLEPIKERLNRKRGSEKVTCINNRFERLIADDYIKISYDTKIYKKHTNMRTLRRLIYDYLIIFDFVNAFFYMDQYIQRKYWNYKKYQQMKHELKKLLERIKEKLEKREDIIVFWTDCVSYYELDWLSKLNEKGKNSLFFEHAYTPVPFTRPAMCAMSDKWMNIDQFGKDELRNRGYHNSILIRKIYEYGYEAKYFDSQRGPCIFDDSIARFNSRANGSSCRNYFNAMNEMLNSEKKQVVIIHSFLETHPPYWYPDKNGKQLMWLFGYEHGGLEKKTGKEYQQILNAAKYWDEQLEFYSDLVGSQTTKIYMSDHGKVYRQHRYGEWVDKSNHIVLFLQSKYASVRKEKRLFTLENFTELIEAVMKAHKLGQEICLDEALNRTYMKVQKVDTYNEKLVKSLKSMHCEEGGHAYRGIRTLEDYYLRFRNRELYYRNGDEETNLIDDPRFADRIAELRALAGDYFIDIEKDKKFKWARELYR